MEEQLDEGQTSEGQPHDDSPAMSVLKAVAWLLVFFVCQVVCSIVAVFAGALVARNTLTGVLTSDQVHAIAASGAMGGALLGDIVFLLVILFVSRRRGGTFSGLTRCVGAPAKAFVLPVVATFCFSGAFNLALTLPALSGAASSTSGGIDTSVVDPLLSAAVLFVLQPIAEEVAFRGMAQRIVRKACSAPVAIFLSAALFGLAHVMASPVLVPFTFCCGLILAITYERTGSLLPAIVAHAAINIAGSLVAALPSLPDSAVIACSLVLLVVSIGAVVLIIRTPQACADVLDPAPTGDD